MPENITFSLESDGNPVSTELQIVSVTVDRAAGRIPSARVIIVDGSPAEGDFRWSNAEDFAPGRALTVKAGIAGDESTLFEGVIVRHRIQVKESGRSHLHLDVRDPFFRTTLHRVNRLFEEVTDADVISEIVGEYGLSAEAEATNPTHPVLVQHEATDWDFILDRARANGRLLLVEDGALRVVSPGPSAENVGTLTYGADIFDMELEMDGRTQESAVRTRTWLQESQEVAEAEAAEPDLPSQGNLGGPDLAGALEVTESVLESPGEIPEGMLQTWADARMLRSRLSRICGRVRCQGRPELTPGTMVTLQGVGERFSGDAYITGVRHELYAGNWTTHVQVGLPFDLFGERSGAARPTRLLPHIDGLQVGKVLQLQDDPLAAERILVNVPLYHEAGTGVWARQARPDAGADRGLVWRPEIDDEVIVGFLGGDPRAAVVLGALHSGANAPPIEASDDNHRKGYVSRSGIRFIFDDETSIVTLETPAGHQLILDDDDGSISLNDANGNTIVMNSDGVEIASAADLVLNAAGDLTLEASGNIEASASGDLTASGTNVETSANAQFTASGSAGAEISSSGQTVVSGSMVMIN